MYLPKLPRIWGEAKVQHKIYVNVFLDAVFLADNLKLVYLACRSL